MDEKRIISFVRDVYQTNDPIPLHEPTFIGRELEYTTEVIKSTYVSSIGKYVDKFERDLELYCNSKAVLTSSGTTALHAALVHIGASYNNLVLTQPLTFVATCNAIHQSGAKPVFIDVCKETLGMDPEALEYFLENYAMLDGTKCLFKETRQEIKAILPMHTFGHPLKIDKLLKIAKKWNLPLIEDAAESLGSYFGNKHTGTLGDLGVLSFNGNKVITTGGGGAILARRLEDQKALKHLTTTAKVKHQYEYIHDRPAFNYRMPNLNAALGSAQIEYLDLFLEKKREIAKKYENFFKNSEYIFVKEPKHGTSNYWLNAIICPSKKAKNDLLKTSNEKGIFMRPCWKLMNDLPMYSSCFKDNLQNSNFFEDRIVNLPSTPIL